MKRIAALILASVLIISVLPLNVSARGKYIRYIAVTDGVWQSPDAELREHGYTVIETDLNLGTGRDDLLMGYKTTDNPDEALRDLLVLADNHSGPAPSDYTYPCPSVGESRDEQFHDDLNEGAFGDDIYLVGSRDPSRGAPITDLYVKAEADPPDDSGWEIVTWHDSDNGADLNAGAGGAYLYLFVKRDYSATGSIFSPPSVWFIVGGVVLVAAGVITTAVIVKKRKKAKA